jgi:hypothetical protein
MRRLWSIASFNMVFQVAADKLSRGSGKQIGLNHGECGESPNEKRLAPHRSKTLKDEGKMRKVRN